MRAMCAVHLKDSDRGNDLMLGLNETIDQLWQVVCFGGMIMC